MGDGVAKLDAVAHALENLTREGDSFATGTFSRFPPPGLRLQNDKHELQLPLPPAHVQALMKRARGSRPRGKGKPTSWAIDSAAVELLNPQWDEFLQEVLDQMRAPMGIASEAKISATLDKVVLHTQGGRFEPRDESIETTRNSTSGFATLVVALPGDFQGGDFVVLQRGKTPIPGPCAVYDVAYVAFYDDCAYRTNPVTSGARLCLVYAVATTTPMDVPLSAGAKLLQHAVDSALAAFFNWHTFVKRQKTHTQVVPATAARTAKEDRFVYVVTSGATFETLSKEDRAVARSLAAFCALTNGAFALYLVTLQCKRVTYREYEGNDDAFDDEEGADIMLWLQSPWLPFKASQDEWMGSTVELCATDVVAPDELWDELKQAEWEIEHKGYHVCSEKTQWHSAYALVVQAVSSQATPGSSSNKKRKAK